jgi:hypothetical protein
MPETGHAMHWITHVEYDHAFKLRLTFETGEVRLADLADHLDGEIFEPLRNLALFRQVRTNPDLDTVVWPNGADMSPDFLYEISVPLPAESFGRVAEIPATYTV